MFEREVGLAQSRASLKASCFWNISILGTSGVNEFDPVSVDSKSMTGISTGSYCILFVLNLSRLIVTFDFSRRRYF